MSSREIHKPLIKSINPQYSRRLLEYMDYTVTDTVGTLIKVEGFDGYNHLIDINSVFSSSPTYEPVDRTGRYLGPFCYSAVRPWQVPTACVSLERAMETRVAEICAGSGRINLFWSGGIDSTTIVVAFLRHAPDLARCRIIYSPWSTYEHPDFYQLLRQHRSLEMVDMSGDVYFHADWDGVFVTGNTGDEMHASLDQSFLQRHGWHFLSTPWRDFFHAQTPDPGFMDRCEEFFSAAGRPIDTVLEARWWFYTSCKLTSIMNYFDLTLLCSGADRFDPARLIGFFDCPAYEQWIYHNLDRIMPTDNYASWRQFLKDYCHDYDGLSDWWQNKTKFHSAQVKFYTDKKAILNDRRNLMLLEDGDLVATPNLPLLSRIEWQEILPRYQHVFRPHAAL